MKQLSALWLCATSTQDDDVCKDYPEAVDCGRYCKNGEIKCVTECDAGDLSCEFSCLQQLSECFNSCPCMADCPNGCDETCESKFCSDVCKECKSDIVLGS